jgi:hypothetical protein
MPTTKIAEFKPNCVFIPANATWQDSRGEHVDPDDATLLKLDGDNNYGEVFDSESWANDGPPRFLRRYGKFVAADESTVEPEHGRVELLPDLYAVKIDERGYWLDPAVLARTKRIYGVYVLDRRQHCHLCSLSASHELHFLGSQWEPVEDLSDEENDDLWDRIMQGVCQSELMTYWDRSDIDQMLMNQYREGLLPSNGNGGFAVTGIKAVTTEDAIEEAIEAYQASEF